MDEAYQRLADEVAAAGGQLALGRGELSLRLDKPVDVRDTYVQHVLRRNLKAVGLAATFHADGGVGLTADETMSHAGQPNLAASTPRQASTPTPAAAGSSARDPEPADGCAATHGPVHSSPHQLNDRAPSPTGSPGPANRSGAALPTADRVGNWLYILLVLVCHLFPSVVHELAPGGLVGARQDAFLVIYFTTLPLSLAATFIFLMLMFDWFDNNKERLVAAGVAIVVSAFVGIGFGASLADVNALSQLPGHPVAKAFQVVALALAAYAIYYGWALFLAAWLSSFVAALWIKEKAGQLEKLRS